jgi:enamine deaminase RidA (YjgF/YER057c/UK114 family)
MAAMTTNAVTVQRGRFRYPHSPRHALDRRRLWRPATSALMPVELINPDDLPTPASYTHVAVASGSQLVFIAGQVPMTARAGSSVPAISPSSAPGVLEPRPRLAAAGATPDQVARITIYVVDHRPEYLPLISAARIAVFGDHKPPDTLLGVKALAEPGYLIEVEAIAVID